MFPYTTVAFTFLFNVLLGLTSLLDAAPHLGHYETISVRQVTHDTGHEDGITTSAQHGIRTVRFYTHGKSIVLKLRRNRDILADNFAYKTSDKRSFEKDTLFSGYIEHESGSDALIAIDDDSDSIMTGTLFFDNLTMHVEPLRLHVQNAPKDEMIIYVLQNTDNLVDNLFSEKTISGNQVALSFQNSIQPGFNSNNNNVDGSMNRVRRSTRNTKCDYVPTKNLCKMYLVADYRFYEKVGGKDEKSTIYHMLQAVRYANKIFKETVWDDGQGCNIGIAVGAVYVLKKPGEFRFNPKSPAEKQENYQNILEYFKDEKVFLPDWDNTYCLAHLFTYRDFKDHVVGYAYIGNTDNGICSEKKVAFSNYFNSARNVRLFTLEANLVTTHEIAHNFGANHDTSAACRPGRESEGGNFLMYNLMVTGYKSNNVQLSGCSINSISKILRLKREKCFTQQNETRCTNGVIDEGEECDPGLFSFRDDECCDQNCRLKVDKQCSDFNHVCCTNCMFTKEEQRKTCHNSFECNAEVRCNGLSANCPNGTLDRLTDNRECDFGKGNCMGEGCIQVCKQLGKSDCACPSSVDSCFICCKDVKTDICEKVRANWDGVPCDIEGTIGTCKESKCTKLKRQVSDEFSILWNDFSLSNFGRFLKKNIVGTVLVFSILFWAPIACLVHYLDKKQDEEDLFTSRWSQRNNSELVLNMGARKRLGLLFRRQAGSAKRVSGGRFHISS